MRELGVKWINHSFMKIIGEEDLIKEVSDFFTFKSPDAKFDRRVKSGHWDGNIRMLDMRGNRLAVGLLPHLKRFCQEQGYHIVVDPKLESERKDYYSIEDMGEFFQKWLNPHSGGKPVKYRFAQMRSIWEALTFERRTLLSPTSSGKSLIIYSLSRMYQRKESMRGLKTLIIVPTTGLVLQMRNDFKDYSSHNGWKTEDNVHLIYGYDGMTLYTDKDIVVSTWQSIYKLPQEWFEQFGAIIHDEVHLAQANSLRSIMEKSVNARYRVGLTGTLHDLKIHHLLIQGSFGPVIQIERTHKMMERGEVAQLDIQVMLLKYPENDRKKLRLLKKDVKMPGKKYHLEMEYLCDHKLRNLLLRNMALKLEGNTLVLFKYVEKHGKPLFEQIEGYAKEGRKVFMVYGGTDTEQRERIRQIVETERDAIIVASYGTFSTGVSIRNIRHVILGSPSKSKILVLQSIGRSLRLSDSKTHATVWDFVDDLSFEDDDNYSLNHGMARCKIYESEKFKFEVHKMELA